MRGKRQDIQGLRALAVALVVSYHVWPDRIAGGYVGVDVFFVISGFLITGHLLREYDDTGSISVTRFWARRIRRLLPAAFLVLAFSFVAALLFLPRSRLEQSVDEILASSLYLQNWLLASNSVDYLAAGNTPSIAQHFWSLSIEEQFYLVWPLLLIFALWVGRKFVPSARFRGSRRTTVAALLVIFATSLAFSVFETQRSAASSYFVSPTRVWEFAAGGLLIFAPALVTKLKPRTHLLVANVLGWIGLGLILAAALYFNAETAFPGYLALVPVVGAAMLIYAGDTQSTWGPSHLSSFGPVQYLGDISYSLYLWHWPLIVLMPFVVGHEVGFLDRVCLIAIACLLAGLTKFFVEDPVRSAAGRRRRSSFAFMVVGMLVFVSAAGAVTFQLDRAQSASAEVAAVGGDCTGADAMVARNQCPRPFQLPDDYDFAFAAADYHYALGALANNACVNRENSMLNDCEWGDTSDPELTIALVGDSHAAHLIDPLIAAAEDRHWRVVLYSSGGCNGFRTSGLAAGIVVTPTEAAMAVDCAEFAREVQQDLTERDDIDVVAFSNRSSFYATTADEASEYWGALASRGIEVLAIRDVPGMPTSQTAPECVELHKSEYDACSSPNLPGTDFMVEAATDSVEAMLIDLTPLFCDDQSCHVVIGGIIAYMDEDHLSFTFATTLAPYLGEAIAEAVDAR